MAAAKKAAGSQAITLHDHIKELRNRFFVVAIIFVVASAVAYNYKDALIYYLLKPLGDEKLIYLNPAGGFSFIFQVTMYVGMAIAIPFLIYNLYRFVAPALPDRARQHSALVMISSLILLCIGVAFGYFIAIPGALNFLNNFADGYVIPSLTAESYLNFILAYTAGLGILFQLPLVLMLIHWIHPLKPLGLLKFERYMILIAFVAAAMITPTPDVMNQTIMAAPIIAMYQIGFVAVCISVAKAKRRARPAKLSRRERKAQQKADRLARKSQKGTRARGKDVPRPVMTPVPVPSMPALIPEAVPVLPAPVARPRSGAPVMDVIAPSRAPARGVVQPPIQASPATPQPSQMRKSMDVMMHPAHTTTRGTIARPTRPVQHRVPPLQVPERPRPQAGLVSVDGISLVS